MDKTNLVVIIERKKMEINNMETGENLGIKCLKFDNHQSCDSLDKLIYQFNDLMYFYTKKSISNIARQKLLEEIEAIGKETAELAFSKHGIEPRREEFIKKMRETYKAVRNYCVGPVKKEDKDDVQKLVNYCVSVSIKAKNGDDNEVLKALSNNKKVYDIYVQPFCSAKLGVNLNLANYCKIQRELMDIIKNNYSFEF